MMEPFGRWVIGLGLAAVVAGVGWRRGSLTVDGAVAAVVVGGVVVGAGGWWLGALVVLFFVTSSALSGLSATDREPITARGSRRDGVQVLANGGAAALAALLFALTREEAWPLAAACAVAAANADTWSTELGRRFGGSPRQITTGRIVPPGTSGAITVIGTVGALAGASLIALGAVLGAGLSWLPSPLAAGTTLATVAAAGFAGALVDSVLGATVQRLYRCPRCDRTTEQPRHRCGARTIPVRGLPGMTNDAVNALATLAAMAGALAVGSL